MTLSKNTTMSELFSKYDWTDKYVKIIDIRKFYKLYAIKVEQYPTLFVKDSILIDRLRAYFFKDIILREEILSVKWNLYVTQGFYVKFSPDGDLVKYGQTPENKDKWFISYLDIAGDLGTFNTIHKENQLF